MKIPQRRTNGFTIVEVTVVIAVIGILAAVVVLSYGNWRTTTAQNEVKSDLSNVVSAMENARNFGNGYPLAIPSSFTASQDVTVTYTSGDATKYCVTGTNKTVTTVVYHIDSQLGEDPQNGPC